MKPDTHPEARREARRLIGQLVELLEEGEHLGAPTRSDRQIVIPVMQEAAPDASDDRTSVRALLAAWLDYPPQSA